MSFLRTLVDYTVGVALIAAVFIAMPLLMRIKRANENNHTADHLCQPT